VPIDAALGVCFLDQLFDGGDTFVIGTRMPDLAIAAPITISLGRPAEGGLLDSSPLPQPARRVIANARRARDSFAVGIRVFSDEPF
jgi:hypothetical protein